MINNLFLYKNVILTYLIAFILTLLPMPDIAVWFWPNWVVLLTFYWVLYQSNSINIGTAWLVGLLLDIFYGSLLGEHAFALLCTAFLLSCIAQKFKHLPNWHTALLITFLLLLYKLLILLVQLIIHQPVGHGRSFYNLIISSLLWPWLVIFVDKLLRIER